MNVNDEQRADRLSQAFRDAIRVRIRAAVDGGSSWAAAARGTGITAPALNRHFNSDIARTKKIPLDAAIAVVAWLATVDGGPEFDEFYRISTQDVE